MADGELPWGNDGVAEKVGVAESTLRRYLQSDTGSMLIGSVIRLADTLGVTVSELVGEQYARELRELARQTPPLVDDEEQTIEALRMLLEIRQRVMDRAAEVDAALTELAEKLATKPA
jgi:transcriptional regulator with XRE-family HTH domain